jgi:hypothetical protein
LTDLWAREAGFDLVFNSQHGSIAPHMRVGSLPRVKIEGGEPKWMFRLSLEGAMDTWRLVDHNLSRLQRVRQELTA